MKETIVKNTYKVAATETLWLVSHFSLFFSSCLHTWGCLPSHVTHSSCWNHIWWGLGGVWSVSTANTLRQTVVVSSTASALMELIASVTPDDTEARENGCCWHCCHHWHRGHEHLISHRNIRDDDKVKPLAARWQQNQYIPLWVYQCHSLYIVHVFEIIFMC